MSHLLVMCLVQDVDPRRHPSKLIGTSSRLAAGYDRPKVQTSSGFDVLDLALDCAAAGSSTARFDLPI